MDIRYRYLSPKCMLKQWLLLKTLFYLSTPPGVSHIIFLFSKRVTGQKRRQFIFRAQYGKLMLFTM